MGELCADFGIFIYYCEITAICKVHFHNHLQHGSRDHITITAMHQSLGITFHNNMYVNYSMVWLNTLRPRQNRRHFADDILKCIFFNKNHRISIQNSIKYVSMGLIDNIPTLVQIMAWHRAADKPLSEAMMALFADAYVRHSALMWLLVHLAFEQKYIDGSV